MAPQTALAAPRVAVERRADGTIIVDSDRAPPPCGAHVGEWLQHWARQAPERVFLAERALLSEQGDAWRTLTYGAARGGADAIAAALLARGHGARPVAMLGDNAINQALLTLGAMQAGIPVLPISPAY